jgi:predicted enzyme related to lactoylglutathione lyase
MDPPLGTLAYLYVGTADFDRDAAFYERVLGAARVWAFHAFGARVAAFRLCGGPLLLLADHRPAPSCLPVFAVADLEAAAAGLKARGWQSDGDVFEVPNGPCLRFTDPSGNQFAILQDDRPDAMERAYADPANPNALRGA